MIPLGVIARASGRRRTVPVSPPPPDPDAWDPTVLPDAPAIDESTFDSLDQLWVDPGGSDANVGSQASPLATIGEGFARARSTRTSSEGHTGTRVNVNPGTYRQTIWDGVFNNSGVTGTAPIVVSATPGTVIIDGSDDWSGGWTSTADTDVFTKPWTLGWGTAPNPWAHNIDIGVLARRAELVVVNNVNLDQFFETDTPYADDPVMDIPATHAALVASSSGFYVDTVNQLMYVKHPSLNSQTVEVGVRGFGDHTVNTKMLRAQSLRYFVIKGFTFRHVVSTFRHAVIDIVNQDDVLVQDCELLLCNGGISIGGSPALEGVRDYSPARRIAVKNVTMHDVGGQGIVVSIGHSILWQDVENLRHNWRNIRGNFHSWSTGNKAGRCRYLTYQRVNSSDGWARGLWLDWDNTYTAYLDCTMSGNMKDGIFLEANQGPVVMHGCTLTGNGENGILTANMRNLTLEGNTIAFNALAQIRKSGNVTRTVIDVETEETVDVKDYNWTFTGNTLESNGDTTATKLLHETTWNATYWAETMETSYFNGNTYRQAVDANVFRIGGGSQNTFATWQAHALIDESSSTFNAP